MFARLDVLEQSAAWARTHRRDPAHAQNTSIVGDDVTDAKFVHRKVEPPFATDPAPHAEPRCTGHRPEVRAGRSLRWGASNGVDKPRRQGGDRRVDVVVRDVEMRHSAQPAGTKPAGGNTGV